MSVKVISNKKHTSFVVHATSNGTLTIAGNSSVSNVAVSNEVLNGASIVQAIYGIAPGTDGHVVVKRGANVVAVYDSTGYHDYAGSGMALTTDSAGTLTIEFSSTGANTAALGFLMLECQKIGANGQSDYFQN